MFQQEVLYSRRYTFCKKKNVQCKKTTENYGIYTIFSPALVVLHIDCASTTTTKQNKRPLFAQDEQKEAMCEKYTFLKINFFSDIDQKNLLIFNEQSRSKGFVTVIYR
jgi:hypothetical protein